MKKTIALRLLIGRLYKLFTKSGFCKEYDFLCVYPGQVNQNPKTMDKGYNVKSIENKATNSHEKADDYLSDLQMKTL